MTLQSQHVTIVIAARIGQAPIYPQIGQGLLGGTIELVLPGDSVSQHKQMDELRLVFEREFDRGALSVDALKLELWQSHWYRASRQAMQRAADMLILAAANEIKIPGSSKLARECEGLAKVLDLFVNAKPTDHPIGDALLRGDPIPAGDGVLRLDLEQSALRVDGITHTALLTADESQALDEQIRVTADAIEAIGSLGLESPEKGVHAAMGAGSTVGTNHQESRLDLLEENLTASRQVCLNEMTLITRGVIALAKAIGPNATEKTLRAMERL